MLSSQAVIMKDSGISWVGKIPSNWQVKRIASLARKITNGYVGATREIFVKEGVPYLQSLHIKENKIVFEPKYFVSPEWSRKHLKSVLNEGDVLIVQTGGVGNTAVVNSEFVGANCHALIIVSTQPKIARGDYLSWLLNSCYGVHSLKSIQTGALHPHLNCGNVRDISIFLPPIGTQKAIATFLDRKTAVIDTLIAKKQRLIELLEERRTALINHAVTKGLNPNVEMEDSGIPWVGDIPKHWGKVKRFKSMINYIEQGWSPSCENHLVDNQECGVLKVGCVNGGYFNELEHKALPKDLKPKLEYKIKTGDILISRANTKELLGSSARVNAIQRNLLLCDKLYRIKTVNNINPAFFVVLMKSKCARHQFERDSSGASHSMQNISQESMKNFILPLPPLEEQKFIIDTLDKNFKTLDNLKEKLLNQIEKLQEYRQSLITLAVTGKINVEEEEAA